MPHARTQHPNAPLTPEGRRRMVAGVIENSWAIEATAERFQVDAKTVTTWRDRVLVEGTLGHTHRRLGARDRERRGTALRGRATEEPGLLADESGQGRQRRWHAFRANRALRRRLDVERSAISNRRSGSPESSPRRT